MCIGEEGGHEPKKWPCRTGSKNVQLARARYLSPVRIARLVLCIGIACTVHRRYMYAASPQLVPGIETGEADPKNNLGTHVFRWAAALPNIYRLGYSR